MLEKRRVARSSNRKIVDGTMVVPFRPIFYLKLCMTNSCIKSSQLIIYCIIVVPRYTYYEKEAVLLSSVAVSTSLNLELVL
jgi:hypothetical protein